VRQSNEGNDVNDNVICASHDNYHEQHNDNDDQHDHHHDRAAV
jgi:hypothetical protein